jgi:tetratricopeptide (TPR) repeat protein
MLGLFLIGAVFLIDRLTIGPLRADIYYKLGLDAANSGGLQESISLFQGATDFAPYQDYYQFFLGQSLVRMAVNTNEPQLRRRIFDRAERVLKKTLEMNTFSTMNIRNLASYYVDRAELEKDPVVRANYLKDALSYYKDASKLSPSNSDLFKEWGHAHFLLDQVDAARRCYKESIDLNAENANTYTLLAELESRQGNLDEALRDISRACQISPTDLKIQSQRALLLKRLNRYNDEIASKLDALLGNNGDPATLNQMSALYVQLGDYHRALSYAQRVYALLPRDKQPAYYPTIQQLQSRLNQ